MKPRPIWAAAVTACALAGCSRGTPEPAKAAKTAPPPRITQFYSTAPQAAKGEATLLCYGVENADKVWLSPPRRELSASLSRCVEVEPAGTTTYTLTAEGAGGETATKTLELSVGPGSVRLEEVRVSALRVKRGEPVSICYRVRNAASVEIAPIGFQAAGRSEGCTVHQPQKTTTYTVTASGETGASDRETVTVTVD